MVEKMNIMSKHLREWNYFCWTTESSVESWLNSSSSRHKYVLLSSYILAALKYQKSKLQFRLFHILGLIQFCLPSLTKLLSRQWYSSCSFDVTFDVLVSDMKRCITKTFVLLTHPRSSCMRPHLRHWQSHLKRDFELTWSKEKIDGFRRCRFPKINQRGCNGDTRSNPAGFDPQIGGI